MKMGLNFESQKNMGQQTETATMSNELEVRPV